MTDVSAQQIVVTTQQPGTAIVPIGTQIIVPDVQPTAVITPIVSRTQNNTTLWVIGGALLALLLLRDRSEA